MEITNSTLMELTFSQFEGLRDTHLMDAIFEGQTIAGINAKSVIFENCHFINMTLWSGEFEDCIFIGCTFNNCNFRFFRLKEIALSKSIIKNCSIKCSSMIKAGQFEQLIDSSYSNNSIYAA